MNYCIVTQLSVDFSGLFDQLKMERIKCMILIKCQDRKPLS